MDPLVWSRRVMVAGLMASMLATACPVVAAMAQPDDVVRGVTERIVRLAEAKLPAGEREREMDRLLADNLDVERLSKAVLGRHWRSADETQRSRFLALLPAYLRATYGHRLGEAAGYRLKLGAPRPLTAGDMVVPAQAKRGGGPPIAIDWRVTPGPDGWRILDLVVEGVSLALAWRNEFDAVIGRTGLNGLLDEMARRVEPRMAAL
jgi:phospholipid transport system substrate-binding protein